MSEIKTVCVFCSSSERLKDTYCGAAQHLGKLLGLRGYDVVFGGGGIGLMGRVASAVQAHGGRMIGVIPEALNRPGVTYELCDELVVTEDMRERKGVMDTRSEAFLALPGGLGTLEEIVEHMTLKQLRYHPKPLVLINTEGFYEPLLTFLDHMIEQNFVRLEHRNLFHVADDPEAALAYLDSYEPSVLPEKFD